MDKTFTVGCNYWASNAGTYMWREWDEKNVEHDLKLLSQTGIDTLRVFPLWEDFQPITRYVGSERKEMRINDMPLDKTPEGVAGVSNVMIERFERFAKLAESYGMKLLVCLINGWMSGRMFFPPAFQGTNPITNKTAVKWEVRFVKYFVNRFKNQQNIIAWEAGNETNVLCWVENGKCSADEYLVWLNTIVNTIKSVDNTRPVVAGMHGLSLNGFISPSDIGEICDIVTVHPYPAFVPHCFTDDLNSIKSRMHSAAESTYYADISGKPCLCEEIGTLGNMLGGEDVAAQYLKANVNSLWANGDIGVMWWCGHDQTELTFPPYDWCGLERELGLTRVDGTYKPVADVLFDMRKFVSKNGVLPKRRRHAVCVLTSDQDSWAVAYSSFILSKQAGFDIMFADGQYEIPQSSVYMLPSLCNEAMPLRTQNELLRRVYEEGATLYISYNDAFISNIECVSGCTVKGNSQRECYMDVEIPEIGKNLSLFSKRKLSLNPVNATVLAYDSTGEVALTATKHGKGTIYFMGFAPELCLVDKANAFENEYYKLYEYIFKKHMDCSVCEKSSPFIGITEHPTDNGTVITAINYANYSIDFDLVLRSIPSNIQVLYGDVKLNDENKISATLEAADICVFKIGE